MTRRSVGSAALVALVALVLAVLLHIEVRMASERADITSLRKDLAAATQGASRDEVQPAPTAGPIIVRDAVSSETVAAIANAVVQAQAREAAMATQAKAEAPRSLDQEKAIATAKGVVATSIARGRLTRDDVLTLRKNLAAGQANQEEMDEVRSQIAVAINAQTLVPEDRHFVYP